MASEEIGTLVARIVADQEQFRTQMVNLARTTEQNTARINRALSSTNRGINSMAAQFRLVTRVAAAFGIALSARALTSFVTGTIKSAAELHNLSLRLNTTAEEMSGLQHVARITDVDFGTLTKSMQIMVRTVGDAERGSKTAQKTIRELGIDINKLSTLTAGQQLQVFAEALSQLGDEARLSLGTDVFGRGFAEITQLMANGAAGMRELIAESERLGLTLSNDAARQADEADDALTRMNATVGALARDMALTLAPAITSVSNKITDMLTRMRGGDDEGPSSADEFQKAIDEQKLRIDEIGKKIAEGGATGFFEWGKSVKALKEDLREAYQELLRLTAARSRFEGRGHEPTAADPLSAFTGIPKPLAPVSGAGFKMLRSPFADPRIEEVNKGLMESEKELTEFIATEHAKRAAAAIDAQIREREHRMLIEEEQRNVMGEKTEFLTEYYTAQLEQRLEIEEMLTGALTEAERIRLDAMQRAADQEVQIARDSMQQQLEIRAQFIDGAIGLLHMLGDEHRGAAIAAIAMEKYFAIQRILINGKMAAVQIMQLANVAAMRALAELGPFVGPPVAATILAKGAAQAAAVKAMSIAAAVMTGIEGAVQASRISGGDRGALGTHTNPLVTTSSSQQPGSAAAAVAGNKSRRVTEVHFHGDLLGWDEFVQKRVVESIRTAVDDRDVILFGRGSRQAQVLVGGT